MVCTARNKSFASGPITEVERLEARVRAWLGGRVRDLRLLVRERGVVLQGRARTYYAKQLAQHAVMQAAQFRIQANEIEVLPNDEDSWFGGDL